MTRLRLIAAGVVPFALTWPLLFRGGSTDGDIPVFRQYGEWIVGGRVPYRDFHPEYPPGAMGLFGLAALAAEHLYLVVFQIIATAGYALGLVLLALLVRRLALSPLLAYGTTVYAALVPAMLGAFVLRRFDMWPTALCVATLILLLDGRPRAALAMLAIATVVKTYPVVLVPIALIYAGRERWRGALAAYCAVGLAVLLPFAAIGHVGLFLSYATQWDRHLHLDSLGAGVLLALHRPVRLSYDAGWSVFGAGADGVAQVQSALEGVGVLVATWLFWRSRRTAHDLVACSVAALAAAAWLGKVLSPQFLLWVAPLVPLTLDWATVVCFTGALLTTNLFFPDRYPSLLAKHAGGITLLDVRNAFLLATTIGLWRALARQGTRTGGERSSRSLSWAAIRGPATRPMR
jgi:hypothetical protein